MTENESIRYLEITKICAEDGSVGELQRQMCDMAISALKEIQQYREIGTVEECREAVEMQKAKKPRDIEYDKSYFVCDNCGESIYTTDNFESHKYCLNCGQRIDFGGCNLEGMEDENT